MTADDVAAWMLSYVEREGCVYQDDVVDMLLRSGAEALLRENADGNVVLGKAVLDAFMRISAQAVVWVRSDRYWRFRVAEDEPGRDARG